MNVPPRVDAVLGGEDVAAHVPLKGEDALFVTPTRTLHYTAEGLLSDESVTEYDHDAERVEVREGRRKSKIVLDYGLEGEAEIPVPGGSINEALHPILAGVLNAAGITQVGETAKRTYRFSELTLVVTSHRVVKHVGSAVWDEEFEEVPFADVTGVGVEEGNVASQLVLETTGRTQRIKAPNEEFRDVRETIEDALFAFHGVSNAAEFQIAVGGDEDDAEPEQSGEVSFDSEPELEIDSGSAVTDTVDSLSEVEQAGQREQPATTSASSSTATGAESADRRAGLAETGSGSAETDAEPASTTVTEAVEGESDAVAESESDAVAESTSDELAESGFEKASSKVPPQVDTAAVRAELDAIESELVAQEAALREQQDRIDAIRDLLPAE